MKKLIAASSIFMSCVFAFALANAEDSQTTTHTDEVTTIASSQQASQGDSFSQRLTDSGNQAGTVDPTPSDSKLPVARSASFCRDDSGVASHKGQKAFDRCMSAKKSTHSPSQLGGQVDHSEDTATGDSAN